MRFITTPVSLMLLLGVNSLFAEAWVRGAAMVVEASGGVEVDVPVDGSIYQSFDQPRYFAGIFACRAQEDGSVLMHMSNGVVLDFKGEGYFSVERIECLLDGDRREAGGLEEMQSRMIMTLRRGELLIDGRHLSSGSKLFLETPFGRISGQSAMISVQIEFDYRKGIYDFTIACGGGIVRFSDLLKQSYTIHAGQRISGAGSSVEPAIEIGVQSDRIRQDFTLFSETLKALDSEGIDWSQLQAHIRPLRQAEDPANASDLRATRPEQGIKRPRVIEFTPRAEPVTPFRGEVKLPFGYQGDSF